MPGVPGRRTHDYVRNGTTNLYAPLDVAPGNVITDMSPRHRAEEIRDLEPDRQLGAGAPGRDLVLDPPTHLRGHSRFSLPTKMRHQALERRKLSARPAASR